MDNLLYALAFIFIVYALSVTGKYDYDNAVMEHQHYCNMVASGAWSDYERRDCSK